MGKAVFEADKIEVEILDYVLSMKGGDMTATKGEKQITVTKILPKKDLRRQGWNAHLLTPLDPEVTVLVTKDQADVDPSFVKINNQGVVQVYSILHFKLTPEDEARF